MVGSTKFAMVLDQPPRQPGERSNQGVRSPSPNRGRQEKARAKSGDSALGGNGGGDSVESRREPLVRGKPIANRPLIAVVELEYLEWPILGECQILPEVAFRDIVKILVPATPAKLIRGLHSCPMLAAHSLGPGRQLGGPVGVIAVIEDEPMQSALFTRGDDGIAEKRFGPQFDSLAIRTEPQCAVVLVATVEAD